MTTVLPPQATYFLYNERMGEPILTTQVFNLLEDLNAESDLKRFEVVVFQNPVVYWLERHLRHSMLLKAKQSNLKVSVYPLALPARGFWSSSVGVKLHSWLFKVTRGLIPAGPVVSRGYMGSYLCGMNARQRAWRVVADPRSLYVRENIGARWSGSDAQYRLWVGIEKSWLTSCHHMLVVNDAMATYYQGILPSTATKLTCVPIYARKATDIRPVKQDVNGHRIRLIYVGSLSASKWNDAMAYRAFFKALAPYKEQLHLTLIVKQTNPEVEDLISSLHALAFEHELHVNLKPGDVQMHMAKADVGLLISEAWDDAGARTGVKTIEYLANSLGLWVTKPLTEVAKLVNRHRLGFVFESTTPEPAAIRQAIQEYLSGHAQIHQAACAYYQDKLSPELTRRLIRQATEVEQQSFLTPRPPEHHHGDH